MKLSALAKDLEPYLIKLIRSIVGDLEFAGVRVDLGKIWHIRSGTVVQYPWTQAGLVSALAATSAGELVLLPVGTLTLTAGVTVPAGVHLCGRGKEKTILTASGAIATLVTLGSASVLSDLTASLTYSGGASAYTITSAQGILRNLIVKVDISGNTTSVRAASLNDIYSVAGSEVVAISDCYFETKATGGEATYMYAIYTDLDTANCISVIRDSEFFIQSDGVHEGHIAYGLYLNCDQSTSRIICYNLTIYADSQGATDVNYPVYMDRATLVSCDIKFESVGYDCIGVTTNGIEDWIIDTKVIGSQSGTDDSTDYIWGIYASDITYIVNSYVKVTGGAGSVDGSVAVNYAGDTGLVMLNSTFSGADDDFVILAGDTASVYGCQYNPTNVTIGGTLTYLKGDRAINTTIANIPDEITATSEGVAASLDTINTEVTTNGDSDLDNVTLANGYSGQVKRIYCVVEGNAADTWKITPATMCGGSQITFAGAGEGCILAYADNEGWVIIGNNGGTIT